MSGLFAGTSLERPVTCERCGNPLDECECPRDASGALCPPSAQQARVRREKRRGKWTTVITGLDPDATDLKALAGELRRSLGAGGTVGGSKSEPQIEIQGDHRDALVELLRSRGYPAKPSGG